MESRLAMFSDPVLVLVELGSQLRELRHLVENRASVEWHGSAIVVRCHRLAPLPRPLERRSRNRGSVARVACVLIGILLWTVRDLQLSPGLVGLIFTAGGVGSFLGAWFGGLIASLTSSQTAMTIGALSIASATLWVAFSAGPRLRSITDTRTI